MCPPFLKFFDPGLELHLRENIVECLLVIRLLGQI